MSSLVTRLLPQGKLLQKSAAGLNSVLQKTASNDLSTSSPAQGSLTIPERLQGIPEAQVKQNKIDIFGENIVSLCLRNKGGQCLRSQITCTGSVNRRKFLPFRCKMFGIIKSFYFATKDPGFFEMVEYFFHKSCVLAEDKLIDVDMKNMRASREEKKIKAHGILKIIEPCAHVLEVNFPLHRHDGGYEMINGYRAQHSHHRLVEDERISQPHTDIMIP